MESLQHASHQRRKRNSTKVNLVLSIGVHAIFVVAGAYWAAHEGMLGNRMRELSVLLVPKEKKPEEAKPREAKPEPAKTTTPQPTTQEAKAAPAPPKIMAPPPAELSAAAAPPPAILPSFSFGDAPKVEETNSAVAYYRTQVEAAFRANWDRPADLEDDRFVAEADIYLDATGKVRRYDWLKGSGNERWDGAVRKALAMTKTIAHPPPQGFPEKFMVRFDVLPMTQIVSQ